MAQVNRRGGRRTVFGGPRNLLLGEREWKIGYGGFQRDSASIDRSDRSQVAFRPVGPDGRNNTHARVTVCATSRHTPSVLDAVNHSCLVAREMGERFPSASSSSAEQAPPLPDDAQEAAQWLLREARQSMQGIDAVVKGDLQTAHQMLSRMVRERWWSGLRTSHNVVCAGCGGVAGEFGWVRAPDPREHRPGRDAVDALCAGFAKRIRRYARMSGWVGGHFTDKVCVCVCADGILDSDEAEGRDRRA